MGILQPTKDEGTGEVSVAYWMHNPTTQTLHLPPGTTVGTMERVEIEEAVEREEEPAPEAGRQYQGIPLWAWVGAIMMATVGYSAMVMSGLGIADGVMTLGSWSWRLLHKMELSTGWCGSSQSSQQKCACY